MKTVFRVLVSIPLMLVAVCSIAQVYSPNNVSNTDIPSNADIPPTDPAIIASLKAQSATIHEGCEFREEAREAIKKGDRDTAFSLLQRANEDIPEDGETCMLLTYFYLEKGQPDNVIATLSPIINLPYGHSNSTGDDITTRMIYILALLDHNSWREAVACYDKSWLPAPHPLDPNHSRVRIWHLPGGGPVHAWPNSRFDANVPDYAGMRAQAHLVLGSTLPDNMLEKDEFPYMLEHLRQVLQVYPNSLDATFVSGWLLGKVNRFAEARVAYAAAMQMASPEAQKEINMELKKLKVAEETLKRRDAAQASLATKPH